MVFFHGGPFLLIHLRQAELWSDVQGLSLLSISPASDSFLSLGLSMNLLYTIFKLNVEDLPHDPLMEERKDKAIFLQRGLS